MRNAFKIFIFLLSVSLITTGISHAQKVIYNMQDLRVLKAQESFLEFFDHALDIKPSLRDTEWSKMTEQMGIAWLGLNV